MASRTPSAAVQNHARTQGWKETLCILIGSRKTPSVYSYVCGEPGFASETKFDSGARVAQLYASLSENSAAELEDRSWFMQRIEAAAPCEASLASLSGWPAIYRFPLLHARNHAKFGSYK
jgi:peptide methionine sulfoxide reductase MsrB